MRFYKHIRNKYLVFIFLILPFIYAKTIKIDEIFLEGDIINPDNEISGMDWHQGLLFLIPENLNNYIYAIPKTEIDEYFLSTNPPSIIPKKIKFNCPNYNDLIEGFEGFEAIAFSKGKVFLLIEANSNNYMKGFIVWGTFNYEAETIFISKSNLLEVDTPIQIDNMSYESIVVDGDNLILLYEANGINLQKVPEHLVFSIDDFSISKINSINIEYRITDATKIDSDGRFWCINYLWPGDKIRLKPHKEIYFNDIQLNKNFKQVERLIELELKDKKILLSKNQHIKFRLDTDVSRNWEGVVRYNNDSFIVVTDKYPRMILGLVKNN